MLKAFIAGLVTQSVLAGCILFVFRQYVGGWITGHINQKYNEKLEEYRLAVRLREQATEIAEYIALARDLQSSDDREAYRRANAAAFKLALYLPAGAYEALGPGLSGDINALLNALSLIRKALLNEEAGDLDLHKHIIVHAPGIGQGQGRGGAAA